MLSAYHRKFVFRNSIALSLSLLIQLHFSMGFGYLYNAPLSSFSSDSLFHLLVSKPIFDRFFMTLSYRLSFGFFGFVRFFHTIFKSMIFAFLESTMPIRDYLPSSLELNQVCCMFLAVPNRCAS